MRSLNVIVVAPEAPDPFGNPAGRWYYVLAKGLSERGHRVRWLAAYTEEAYAANARGRLDHFNLDLRLYPPQPRHWLRRKWNTLRRPYSYFVSDSLARDLRSELTKGYDVLHLESTWCGWLGLRVPRAILSIQWLARIDMAARREGWNRQFLSGLLMKRTERRLINWFSVVRALTPRDASVIRQLNPDARVVTVPLAIDPSLYPFGMTDPDGHTIGLIGSMGWRPTSSAATRLASSIWPRVKAMLPDARLLMVGRGARRSLKAFLGRPDVTILEDVSETESYFRRLSVLVYPVPLGSGMKVKVMEAMAYGVPVVTTSEGVQGLEALNGVHAVVAEDDDTIADQVVRLVRDPQSRHTMSLAARHLIEEKYSPEPVLSRIERVYSVIQGSRRVTGSSNEERATK